MAVVNLNCAQLTDQTDQFVNLVMIYRLPVFLNINYLKSMLKLGNQAVAAGTIASFTQKIFPTASSSLTLKTLYDTSLTPPNIYFADETYS